MTFITVDVCDNPLDAHIMKGLLESEGIPVFIAHENHIYADWPMSQALGGVKLQVTTDNVAAANDVLTAYRAGKYANTLDEDGENRLLCPQCHGHEIKNKLPLIPLLFVIFTLGFGVIFPVRRSVHVCSTCGHKWRD